MVEENYERRRSQAEQNQQLGRIEQQGKDTKDQLKQHCSGEDEDRRELKKDLMEIKVTLAQAIICPYEGEIKGIKDDIVEDKKDTETKIESCKNDKGMVKEERKWIYGGMAVLFTIIGIWIKKLFGTTGGGG